MGYNMIVVVELETGTLVMRWKYSALCQAASHHCVLEYFFFFFDRVMIFDICKEYFHELNENARSEVFFYIQMHLSQRCITT